MRSLLLSLLLLTTGIFSLTTAAAAEKFSDEFIVTKLIVGDLYLYNDDQFTQLIAKLQSHGINTVTLPIAWSIVEPRPQTADFRPYYAHLDRLVEAGFKLILILDSSARELLTPAGLPASNAQIAIPEWLYSANPNMMAKDFSNRQSYNLDYHDRQHLPALDRFYQQALNALGQRYRDAIVAFVPGLTHELEIKYAQYDYRWQIYGEAAQQAFNTWLSERGQPPAPLPIIDYGNALNGGQPRFQPLFEAFMDFRETALTRYVCRLTAAIRQAGFPAGAYFGQSLSSHDAIYALGVIERLTDCLDKVTVDYNYYDGWRAQPNPDVLPLLVNYAHNLGYPQVLAGLYVERLYAPNGRLMQSYWPAVNHTIKQLAAERSPLAGLEIGNLHTFNFYLLPELELEQLARAARTQRPKPARFQVGLVASKWTFYTWIGDYTNRRALILDALLASYRLLTDAPDIDVAVLGEQALLTQDLSRYHALVMPHQTTLSDAALTAVRDYHRGGGRLVQDIRFDAFAISGEPKLSWANDLFGIQSVAWRHQGAAFRHRDQTLWLPKQLRSYFSHALLTAQPGYQLLLPSAADPQQGLLLRGPRSLVFGFLPQLVEDQQPRQAEWRALYIDSIRALLASP